MASPEKLTTTEPAQAEFTREQLLVVAKAEPEVLVDLVLALQAQMRVLQQEVRELKERLALNSRNSHKPPGSDGLGKQGRNLLESITDALNGDPFIPASPT